MVQCAEDMIKTLLISAQNVVKVTEEFKASIGKKKKCFSNNIFSMFAS